MKKIHVKVQKVPVVLGGGLERGMLPEVSCDGVKFTDYTIEKGIGSLFINNPKLLGRLMLNNADALGIVIDEFNGEKED